MFVNLPTLMRYKTLPESVGSWCLDSGGFATLKTHGRWQTSAKQYSLHVERFADEIGGLEWAAPMDWMCEPTVVKRTGLSVTEHQRRTIQSFLFLQDRIGDLVTPVLQGWRFPDYFRHMEMYEQAGVDLASQKVIGLGSVCRRNQTSEIVRIIKSLHDEGLRLHAFGVKGDALVVAKEYLVSADSMAWSFQARYAPPLRGCTTHKNCANCAKYAIRWRNNLLGRLGEDKNGHRGS